MRYLLILFLLWQGGALLAQNNFPIPTPQPIASPTAMPTVESVSTDSYPLEGMNNSLATVQAELSQPISIDEPSQIEFLANVFGYAQYIGTHNRELFGVFSPLFTFVLFLTPIALLLLLLFVGNLIVTTIYSLVSDIYRKIRG